MNESPYHGLSVEKWLRRTQELVAAHPLRPNELKDAVLRAWEDIFISQLGQEKWRIGKEIFPTPQIMGFFLHEFIALRLATAHPRLWRGDQDSTEKDLVCLKDPAFSVEIKTSSNARQIFGNRSYAQPGTSLAKKGKSGYYLAVNFQGFSGTGEQRPELTWVRFGWIDSSDWIAQKSQTGQQCRLPRAVYDAKFVTLYRRA